jgi:3-dehydroquinate synthetase
MEVDKKNEGGAIKFILIKPLGSPDHQRRRAALANPGGLHRRVA